MAVATSDAHTLDGFGRNYCLVETPTTPTWELIRESVIQGKFTNQRPGIPLAKLGGYVAKTLRGLACGRKRQAAYQNNP